MSITQHDVLLKINQRGFIDIVQTCVEIFNSVCSGLTAELILEINGLLRRIKPHRNDETVISHHEPEP
jgi:hypothetical protein